MEKELPPILHGSTSHRPILHEKNCYKCYQGFILLEELLLRPYTIRRDPYPKNKPDSILVLSKDGSMPMASPKRRLMMIPVRIGPALRLRSLGG